jgi:hypothetical protein
MTTQEHPVLLWLLTPPVTSSTVNGTQHRQFDCNFEGVREETPCPHFAPSGTPQIKKSCSKITTNYLSDHPIPKRRVTYTLQGLPNQVKVNNSLLLVATARRRRWVPTAYVKWIAAYSPAITHNKSLHSLNSCGSKLFCRHSKFCSSSSVTLNGRQLFVDAPVVIYIPARNFRSVHKIARSHYQLRHVSVCLSVCPSAWNNQLPLDGYSRNFIFERFSISAD